MTLDEVADRDACVFINPLIRIVAEPKGVELPIEGCSYAVSDDRLFSWLPFLAQAATVSGVLGSAAQQHPSCAGLNADALQELIAARLIAVGSKPPSWAAAEEWISRGWMEALLFHLESRQVNHFVDEGGIDADAFHNERLATSAANRPPAWTHYDGEKFSLPSPGDFRSLPPLTEVLLRRRSNRPWQQNSLSAKSLSTLLHLASTETVSVRRRYEAGAASNPSLLMLSPFTALELYVAIFESPDLDPGLYHYQPDTHELVQRKSGLFREQFQKWCAGQHRAGSGAASFIITSVWARFMHRYPQPGAYQTLLMNVGELSQKILTVATGLGLSTFLTPAFDDEYGDRLLGFDPEVESAVEVIGVG